MAPLLSSKAEHTACGRFKKSIFKSYFKIHDAIIQPLLPHIHNRYALYPR